MDGPKTPKTDAIRKAPIRVQGGLWDSVRVVDSKLGEIHELAIDEDFDSGGDPYNSTGQHVILEMQRDEEEPADDDTEPEQDDSE